MFNTLLGSKYLGLQTRGGGLRAILGEFVTVAMHLFDCDDYTGFS